MSLQTQNNFQTKVCGRCPEDYTCVDMVIKADENVFIRDIQGCILIKLYEAVSRHLIEIQTTTTEKSKTEALKLTTEATTEAHDFSNLNLIVQENEGFFLSNFKV